MTKSIVAGSVVVGGGKLRHEKPEGFHQASFITANPCREVPQAVDDGLNLSLKLPLYNRAHRPFHFFAPHGPRDWTGLSKLGAETTARSGEGQTFLLAASDNVSSQPECDLGRRGYESGHEGVGRVSSPNVRVLLEPSHSVVKVIAKRLASVSIEVESNRAHTQALKNGLRQLESLRRTSRAGALGKLGKHVVKSLSGRVGPNDGSELRPQRVIDGLIPKEIEVVTMKHGGDVGHEVECVVVHTPPFIPDYTLLTIHGQIPSCSCPMMSRTEAAS